MNFWHAQKREIFKTKEGLSYSIHNAKLFRFCAGERTKSEQHIGKTENTEKTTTQSLISEWSVAIRAK